MEGKFKRKLALLFSFFLVFLNVAPVYAAEEIDISTYIELPLYYLESRDFLHRRIYSQSVSNVSGTQALKYVVNAYGINQYYGTYDMIFEVRASQKIDKTKLYRTALYVQCCDIFGKTYGGKSQNEITAVTYPDDKTVRFHIQNQIDHTLVSSFPYLKLDYQQNTLNAGEGYEFHIYFKGVNADGVVVDSSTIGSGGSGGDPGGNGECCNDLKSLLNVITEKLDAIVVAIGKIGSVDNSAITGNADKNAQDIQNNANQNAQDIKNNANQNSQDIQDNANQNSQDIQDNANQNSKDIQNNSDKNTGIIQDKLEDTKKGIISGLIDGLKGLFIPDGDYFARKFNELNTFFSDHLGFLYLPIDLFVRMCNIILNAQTDHAVLTFPAFSIMGYDVWSDQEFDLGAFLKQDFPVLLSTIQMGTSVVIVTSFIGLVHDKYEEVFNS